MIAAELITDEKLTLVHQDIQNRRPKNLNFFGQVAYPFIEIAKDLKSNKNEPKIYEQFGEEIAEAFSLEDFENTFLKYSFSSKINCELALEKAQKSPGLFPLLKKSYIEDIEDVNSKFEEYATSLDENLAQVMSLGGKDKGSCLLSVKTCKSLGWHLGGIFLQAQFEPQYTRKVIVLGVEEIKRARPQSK